MTETNRRTPWATLVFFLGLVVASTAHEADLVTDLPGQSDHVGFKHYAGYVTLDPGPKQREVFYWFFEADHPNASSRPVALWIQGGPGCSGVGYGALSEVGPFLIKDGKLVGNKYSWNKEVNLIFVDLPVEVGFSFTNDTKYEFNDHNTAADSYKFLVGWFKKFPKYTTNEFYLLGESYAGHFVPELARQILLENEKSSDFKLNFRGFNIGNPWTDSYLDNKGTLQWYLSHSLISEETFNLALSNCNLSISYYIGDVGNAACKEAERDIYNVDLSEVDIDNIYEDTCNLENTTIGSNMLFNQRRPSKRQRLSSSWHHGQNPCAPDGVLIYLNTPAVQKALHVPTHVNWTDCSDSVGNLYSHVDSVRSMLPVYKQLLKTDIKMWIYSGDWDGNVPTTGTRAWIKSLELPIVMKWRPWDYKSQVGGWTQVYKGLTFTTVRGAGHMVPTDQPGKALEVFQRFLVGEPLPMFHLISNRR
ncbi:unnamed protein product [Calypogeia fissa]